MCQMILKIILNFRVARFSPLILFISPLTWNKSFSLFQRYKFYNMIHFNLQFAYVLVVFYWTYVACLQYISVSLSTYVNVTNAAQDILQYKCCMLPFCQYPRVSYVHIYMFKNIPMFTLVYVHDTNLYRCIL